MKNIVLKIPILCISLIILVGCEYVNSPKVLTPNGDTIEVELAKSKQELRQGLMFRNYLPTQTGMLFIFEKARRLSFWMKNTLIPLDIIYMDEQGVIVSMTMMEPCPREADHCPYYPSEAEALYALEINAGEANALGLAVGDQLAIQIPYSNEN